MKGMLVECADCGYTYSFNFDKAAEEIEAQANEFIQKGWRHSSNRSGFICPGCQNGTSDKFYQDGFYQIYAGKAKVDNKTKSYAVLMQDISCQLQYFNDLDCG
jgi:hypothetical protein